PTYATTAADGGHRLRLRVVATSTEGSTAATSASTAPVTPLGVETPTPSPSPAPTPAPAATATPVAAQPFAAPPVEPPAGPTAAFRASGRTAATLRWGRAREVSGRLLHADGSPIAGATIALSSRASVVSAALVPLRPLITDADGGFAYLLRSGVSRTITF